MKKVYVIGIVFVLVVLLSFVAVSQISPIIEKIKSTEQITPNIKLDKTDTCITETYEEIETTYGDCTYYHNVTLCLNTSGPNTECSETQTPSTFSCKIGEAVNEKTKETCKPEQLYDVVIGNNGKKLQIDYSNFGPCRYEEQNNCLIVTCVSWNDGARNNPSLECRSGMSCEKFEICENSTKTFYRNSNDEFLEEDDSFFLPKLEIKEVGE